jgi:Uma2 family endonuclease
MKNDSTGIGTMGKRPQPSEQRILLEKINWQKFELLLQEMGAERTTRFTYDRTRLELMNPLDEHERYRKLIESLILVLVDELDSLVEGYTVPNLQRADRQCGIEPDAAYYFQQAGRMSDRATIDLMRDPPPDLIADVTLTRCLLDPLPIYAEFGVPEIWRYVSQPGDDFCKGELQIYHLAERGYVPASHSLALPFLPAQQLQTFIAQSDALGLMPALRVLRAWVQETLEP